MSSVDNTTSSKTRLLRFNPEPGFSGSLDFKSVLNSLGGVANSVLRSTTGVSVASSIDNEYQDIIDKQIELQEQMMLVSMHSNLEKTKHDTRMAPVRNLRVA